MFDFDKPELGSLLRFNDRLSNNTKPHKKIKHIGWWLVHNCIAHFMIGILPIKLSFDFHDWTSVKLNQR